MSHFRAHRRRHMEIRRKLLGYLTSGEFQEQQSCSEALPRLLLLARRYGRWDHERVGRYSEYGREKPTDDIKAMQAAGPQRGDELLRTSKEADDPRSIGALNKRFVEHCVLRRPR